MVGALACGSRSLTRSMRISVAVEDEVPGGVREAQDGSFAGETGERGCFQLTSVVGFEPAQTGDNGTSGCSFVPSLFIIPAVWLLIRINMRTARPLLLALIIAGAFYFYTSAHR